MRNRVGTGKVFAATELEKFMEFVVTETEGDRPATNPEGPLQKEHGPARRVWLFLKQVLACLIMAGMAYGCFHLSQQFLLETIQVTGRSMSPTLPDADRYLLNRLVYRFREPRPGDIVVLRDPEDKGFAIKRIVAKPGDSVYVKDGNLFVNGKRLKEPYLKTGTQTFASPRYSAQFWVCGASHYFVLGDNRNNSTDSRNYGTVPRHNILGMVAY